MTLDASLGFHGAAGCVTGSKHLLRVGETRILLDAGMFQGRRELRKRNWEPPGFDPAKIDHAILTHSHIDHCGFLPRLVKLGLDAPVHCTPAAHELIAIMLRDSARIQEQDAAYANRKKYSKHDPALPLYTSDDAEDALALRSAERFNVWFPCDREGKVRARFRNVGHILGSGFVEIEIRTGKRPLRVVFSGDVGRFDMPLHLDPRPLPACDILLLESTYGDRLHKRTKLIEQIDPPIRETLARGGTVLIPAFAVGRSQQVTLMLRRLMQQGELPQVPIHIDSPMAVDATRIYSRFLDKRNLDPELLEDGRLRLFPEGVELCRDVEDSKRLNQMKGPRIIIASSGMLSGGRVLHHLKQLAPDPKNLLLLVGYQAPGTRGDRLLNGDGRVRVHGQDIPVRAEVMTVHGLSGHADRDGLLRFVESAPAPPKAVCVVHGEPDPAKALAEALRERFGCRTFEPALGDELSFESLLPDVDRS
jgi:metallo-beta-lactamase family protein